MRKFDLFRLPLFLLSNGFGEECVYCEIPNQVRYDNSVRDDNSVLEIEVYCSLTLKYFNESFEVHNI